MIFMSVNMDYQAIASGSTASGNWLKDSTLRNGLKLSVDKIVMFRAQAVIFRYIRIYSVTEG